MYSILILMFLGVFANTGWCFMTCNEPGAWGENATDGASATRESLGLYPVMQRRCRVSSESQCKSEGCLKYQDCYAVYYKDNTCIAYQLGNSSTVCKILCKYSCLLVCLRA